MMRNRQQEKAMFAKMSGKMFGKGTFSHLKGVVKIKEPSDDRFSVAEGMAMAGLQNSIGLSLPLVVADAYSGDSKLSVFKNEGM